MKIKISRQLDLLSESIGLLRFVAEDKDFRHVRKRIEEINLPDMLWKDGVQVLEHMVKQAEKEFRREKELITKYYRPMTLHDEDDITLAEICMLHCKGQYGRTLEQVEHMLLKITDKEICKKMNRMLRLTVMEGNKREKDTFSSVISVLEETDLNQEQKWNMINTMTNLSAGFAKIRPLLERAQELILSFQKEWQPIVDEMADNWEQYLEGRDILNILRQYLNAQLEENPQGAVLIPGILSYNQMMYQGELADEEENEMPDAFYLGFMFSTMENFEVLTIPSEEEKLSREYFMRVLKALAEKSKLEILIMLKEKRMYGSELAEALGLTTATISHHMNTLMVLKLVIMEKEENKVYYEINERGIWEVFQELKELLL